MRPQFKTITVRELLSHQTGLIENASREFFEPSPREQRTSFVRWALQQPPVSARGTYHYANANYIVVGAAIERLLNAPYEQIIVEQLFAPLGITTAGWGAPGTPGREDQPWPHSVDAANHHTAVQPSESADNPPIYSPAGRVHMSIGDWAKWIQAVLRAEAGQPSPWSAATARELTAPAVPINATDSYAFGWIAAKRDWAGPTARTLNHAGSNTMNFAVAWLAPDAGFAVLVATNQGGDPADRATNGVAGRLIELYVTGR
jgi:CubicO group peptidase (beta-lactamase class C family)